VKLVELSVYETTDWTWCEGWEIGWIPTSPTASGVPSSGLCSWPLSRLGPRRQRCTSSSWSSLAGWSGGSRPRLLDLFIRRQGLGVRGRASL